MVHGDETSELPADPRAGSRDPIAGNGIDPLQANGSPIRSGRLPTTTIRSPLIIIMTHIVIHTPL
eukprot:COSAG02_NODE_29455_length_569_cov_0.442553_1_plen_64_part_01